MDVVRVARGAGHPHLACGVELALCAGRGRWECRGNNVGRLSWTGSCPKSHDLSGLSNATPSVKICCCACWALLCSSGTLSRVHELQLCCGHLTHEGEEELALAGWQAIILLSVRGNGACQEVGTASNSAGLWSCGPRRQNVGDTPRRRILIHLLAFLGEVNAVTQHTSPLLFWMCTRV